MSESIDTELRDVLLEAMDSYCEGFALWLLGGYNSDRISLGVSTFVSFDDESISPKELVKMYKYDQTNSTPIR